MKKVTVLGDGAFGTAFATLLASNNYRVTLWCYNKSIADSIKNLHINPQYLPMVQLSPLIQPTTSLQEALVATDWVFEAIPVAFLRSVLTECIPYIHQHRIVFLSKGMELGSHMLPTQIAQSLGYKRAPLVLSGPSFAYDLARHQPTAVDLAYQDLETACQLQALITTNYFITYLTTDVIGVQAGGAGKNVIALALGILAGAGYSDNAKALALTQGLRELGIIIEYLAGKRETVYGLAGVGDLLLTAYGTHSKNFSLGLALGQGKTLTQATSQFPTPPEGINTLKSVSQLIKQGNLRLPLCSALCEIMLENKPTKNLIKALGF